VVDVILQAVRETVSPVGISAAHSGSEVRRG